MKKILSIVIPTKNRYKQLEKNLSFLLNTDSIKSTQIVIFDNSDSDYRQLSESKKIFLKISNFSKKLNLKIIQESNLSMTDNWEKALDYSIGYYEYSMLIEDKQILRKDSVTKIINFIKDHKPAIILYKTSTIINHGSNYLLIDNSEYNKHNMPNFFKEKNKYFKYYNNDAVDIFFKSKNYFEMMFLPRCLNCVVSNKLISKLKTSFIPTDKILKNLPYPDFALGFNLYMFNPKVTFLNDSLSVFFAKNISTHTRNKSIGLKEYLRNTKFNNFEVILSYFDEKIILKNIYNLPYLITLMQFQYFQKKNKIKIFKPSFDWLINDIQNTINGGGSWIKITYFLWSKGINKGSFNFKFYFIKLMVNIFLKSLTSRSKIFIKKFYFFQKIFKINGKDEEFLINKFFVSK